MVVCRSLAAIRAKVRQEIEAEKLAEKDDKLASAACTKLEDEKPATNIKYAVEGVFFRCPVIGEEVLPFKEWDQKIREFLQEQFASDPALTAVLMIHSLNKNREKVNGN